MSTASRVLRIRSLTPKMAAAAAVALCALVLAACGSKTQQQAGAPGASTPESAGQTGTTEPVSAAPAEPALAVTEASWSPDALQKLVAPIALYPDQLVGQILTASVNSQEVLDGGNWLLQNQSLKGDALTDAAQKAGLGPAMQALVQFPSVVDMMCQEIDWTRQLGAAFTSDQSAVLDAVQSLRAQAAHVGNLKSTPQQKVETRTEDNKQVIVIQPADPQIVYVPQYNPTVVYTTPPAPAAPAAGTVSTGAAVAGGLIAFGVGALVGSAIASNNCYPHWGVGAVYIGPRPFYPPAYVYRPVYGPAFRPATGYVPPPGYRYSYNNVNVNNVRVNNVNVNNNYFNQFNHNQNLSGATRNTPGAASSNPSWKGQSTYAGARASPAQQARFNEATGRPASAGPSASSSGSFAGASSRTAPGESSRSYQNEAGGAGRTRTPALANSPRSPAQANNRSPATGSSQNRTSSGAPGPGAGSSPDRGYGSSGGARDANGFSRPAQPPSASSGRQRDQAFSGATEAGGGGFARAASARGNASAGGLGHAGGGLRRP
jgi:Protein of unknown function (DUF3300)